MKKDPTLSVSEFKELVKPTDYSKPNAQTVESLCEPNSCTIDCNGGGVNNSPADEQDILF